MKDRFVIKILEDGTLQIDSEDFSPAVHAQADEFVALLGRLMGGAVEVREKRTHAKQHHHEHEHNEYHHHH